MIYHHRRRIRSGHLGILRQRKDVEKKEGFVTVTRSKPCPYSGELILSTLNLSYTIYHPELMNNTNNNNNNENNHHDDDDNHKKKKPLVVIHGGPGIPSDYLQPMAQYMKDRCVIFFDQIGCGKSSRPKQIESYSIEMTVQDLFVLIQHLKLKDFHIYGHSFGAIVAYEFSKSLSLSSLSCEAVDTVEKYKEEKEEEESTCDKIYYNNNNDDDKPRLLSMTLCSAPSNVRQVDDECKELMESLRPRSNSEDSDIILSSSIEEESTNDDSQESTCDFSLLFQKQFVCRTNHIISSNNNINNYNGILPKPLQEAYNKRGDIWEGTDVILDYVAQPLSGRLSSNNTSMIPHILLLKGEYDFVSDEYAFEGWMKLMNNHNSIITCQSLDDCSHYSMLENPQLHSFALNTFLSKIENML